MVKSVFFFDAVLGVSALFSDEARLHYMQQGRYGQWQRPPSPQSRDPRAWRQWGAPADDARISYPLELEPMLPSYSSPVMLGQEVVEPVPMPPSYSSASLPGQQEQVMMPPQRSMLQLQQGPTMEQSAGGPLGLPQQPQQQAPPLQPEQMAGQQPPQQQLPPMQLPQQSQQQLPTTRSEAPMQQVPAQMQSQALPAPMQIQEPPQTEPVGTYKLRLCNAYAWPKPLEMRRVEEPQLVEYPLPYKACHDYLLPLREGDQLQFRAGDVSIGTFSVRGLPADPQSLLLLIPHRRDADSAAVAFDSHTFKGIGSPQLAVIDAYRGSAQSSLMIQEPLQQELKFNSVVAVMPGAYRFSLMGWGQSNARATLASALLKAKAEENYVVLRVGTGSRSDHQFPEELVIFPQKSGAICVSAFAVATALLASLAMHAA